MKVPLVDLAAQYQNHRKEIDAAIASVIAETAFVRGKYVAAFEAAYREAYGVRHCISVANGTDAIYIVFKMLGVGVGDEVITTANSWIASSETITQAGATPVFVDVEPEYFNLSPAAVEKAITSRTKAVLAVHLLGQPAQVDELADICKRHNLFLVEDCAQAHFAEFKGQRVGTFGVAATFSFYPGKNLGAYGDAGAVVTNDDDLAAKFRMYANHGADRTNKHEHEMEGINSRLDGLQAAILSAKLPHLADWTAARREKAAAYTRMLADIPQVKTPAIRKDATHVFHVYSVLAEDRDALQSHLESKGIGTTRHYPTPLPFLKAYKRLGYTREQLPVVSKLQGEMLSLPIFPELTAEQMAHVVDSIKEFYASKSR